MIEIALTILCFAAAGILVASWIRFVWRRGSKNTHDAPPVNEAVSSTFHSSGPI
jgi:hypothetical protein